MSTTRARRAAPWPRSQTPVPRSRSTRGLPSSCAGSAWSSISSRFSARTRASRPSEQAAGEGPIRPDKLGRLSTLHKSYALASRCPVAQTLSSLDRASRPIGERPLPDLITEIPGPKARAHVKFDEEWTSPSLPRAYPIVPVRGAGMAIEDIDGNLFLDFAAGIAVNSTGHAHPRVVAAIKEQASDLIHYSASDFYLPVYAEAARELARIAPMSGKLRTYLGNSGAEMVEAAAPK